MRLFLYIKLKLHKIVLQFLTNKLISAELKTQVQSFNTLSFVFGFKKKYTKTNTQEYIREDKYKNNWPGKFIFEGWERLPLNSIFLTCYIQLEHAMKNRNSTLK